MTAEQDDLEDARALAAPGRIFGRLTELVEQYLDDALKLALLRGRKMIDVGSHVSENLREVRPLWQGQIARRFAPGQKFGGTGARSSMMTMLAGQAA